MWQQPEPWPGVQVTLSKRTPVASNRPRSKAPAMRQSVASLSSPTPASTQASFSGQRAHLEGDAVVAALDVGRIHAAAVGADGQERFADGARIVGPEAGEGCCRDLPAALFDGADHDRLGRFGAQFGGQFVEQQPVEIGAVAEGGVELALQFFGASASIAHAAACPCRMEPRDRPRPAPCRSPIAARPRSRRAAPVSTMRPCVHDGDAVGEGADTRARSCEMNR